MLWDCLTQKHQVYNAKNIHMTLRSKNLSPAKNIQDTRGTFGLEKSKSVVQCLKFPKRVIVLDNLLE